MIKTIDVPHTFEELRTVAYGASLTPLIDHLRVNVHHIELVSALMSA